MPSYKNKLVIFTKYAVAYKAST